jgi:glyoxylase-like metal-dependent hydrolase (beta-lactamase superfamily II)
MFESSTWTAVPGTGGVEIYPILRKPSIVCSSTFILKTPKEIIIIDPGGDAEQVGEVNGAVVSLLQEGPLPVYVFLTHCHVDHFVATPFLDPAMHPLIVCHEATAIALEGRDRSATMAEMIDMELPSLEVAARFFDEGTTRPYFACLQERRLDLPSGGSVMVHPYAIGEGDILDVIHTPGHSPDSISFRVGPLLFPGDLQMATTPGIAGIKGWDNVKLAASLEAIIALGKATGATVLMPGHGIPLPFDKAARIFEAVRKEALALSDLAVLSRERADYLSEFAVVLLEEGETIFSIISGRLLKVSHYLEMLDEETQAAAILESIDSNAIDAGLDEFYYFTAELKGLGGVPLISKAVQFAKKIEKVFEPGKVSKLVDPCLLRRLKSLLSDFVNAGYGISFRNQETSFDLHLAVSGLLERLAQNPYASESIFESLDTEEDFLRELTGRIAYTPLFASTRLTLAPCAGEASTVFADRERFQDCLSALLEQFSILNVTDVVLETRRQVGTVSLLVRPAAGASGPVRESKLAYLRHSVEIAGGSFRRLDDGDGGGRDTYLFEFPTAE